MTDNNKWYGWIPTNLGKINFDFIDEENIKINYPDAKFYKNNNNNIVLISNIKLKNISDSTFFSLNLLQKEHYSSLKISLINYSNTIRGKISIVYSNTIKIGVEFTLQSTGEVEFGFTSIDTIDEHIDYISIIDSIKQIVFIILKSIVHGDGHHHQKIDTAIKITNNNFQPITIVDSMLLHIKQIERNSKLLKNRSSLLKQNIVIDEVKGYISYIKTFKTLFDTVSDDKIRIAENIKESLEAIVRKRIKRDDIKSNFKVTLLTIMAMFIATNIFINSIYSNAEELEKTFLFDFTRYDLFVYSAMFWIGIYFLSIWYNLKNYIFYNFYSTYRFFRNLYILIKYVLTFLLILATIIIGIALLIIA